MPDINDRPIAADIEVTQPGAARDGVGGDVLAPSVIRINGINLLTSADHPVTIHEIQLKNLDVVYVTLTLFARRVRVGFADELHLCTEEQVQP